MNRARNADQAANAYGGQKVWFFFRIHEVYWICGLIFLDCALRMLLLAGQANSDHMDMVICQKSARPIVFNTIIILWY